MRLLTRPSGRATLVAGCLLAVAPCGGTSAGRATTNPSITTTTTTVPAPQDTGAAYDLSTYAGVYHAPGATYLLTRSALLVNTADGSVHAIAVASPGVISVGRSFGELEPTAGTLTFPGWRQGDAAPTEMELRLVGRPVVRAARLATVSNNEIVRNDGALLAATFTRPARSGRVPAIVIVHGSGMETRAMLDLWTQLYVSLGFGVLTYDKRGVGSSTGVYPGDVASTATLHLLAGDVAAVVRYVRTRRDVNPRIVALYGGSQGGWVLPIADKTTHPAFDIIASGPPLSVGQQGLFSSFSDDGQLLPSQTPTQIEKQLAGAASGFDPLPTLAKDAIPTVWLFGSADRHVPVALAVRNLKRLRRPNFAWHVYPGCSHSLLLTGSGLDPADNAATRFGPGLFADIAAFTRRMGVVPPA